MLLEIAKVAKQIGADEATLKKFEAATKETQFAKAIADVKGVLPQSLLINGHNPLHLLHNALSEGIHAGTDGECLELATSIRIVLSDLIERIAQALKDEQELNKAVGRLFQKPTSPTRANASKSINNSQFPNINLTTGGREATYRGSIALVSAFWITLPASFRLQGSKGGAEIRRPSKNSPLPHCQGDPHCSPLLSGAGIDTYSQI